MNPLELLADSRLAMAIINICYFPRGIHTVVNLVDNTSACACVNMGRALSRTMRSSLRFIMNIQRAHSIRIIVQHVRTEKYMVAYLFRRVNHAKAE